MKEIYIDGKKYYQQENSDIDRLPRMEHSKDMLKKCRACEREQLMKENPKEVFMMNAIAHTCKENKYSNGDK